jgi:thiosulfate dehydrogenase
MKLFLLGIAVTLRIIPLAGFLYIRSIYMPVAATDPTLPFERFLAGMALRTRTHLEAPHRDVAGFTTADLVAGAQTFRDKCAFCHGLPHQAASVAGAGMFPHAPQLFTTKGNVSNDPAGVTYWKVRNGIRLTGMPSFKASLTDQRMWQVSALLARSNQLSTEVQDALRPAVPAVTPPLGGSKPQ